MWLIRCGIEEEGGIKNINKWVVVLFFEVKFLGVEIGEFLCWGDDRFCFRYLGLKWLWF